MASATATETTFRRESEFLDELSSQPNVEVTAASDSGYSAFRSNNILLAAGSGYFRKQLFDDVKEGMETPGSVVVPEKVTSRALEAILEFISTGKVTIGSTEDTMAFLDAADTLEVTGINRELLRTSEAPTPTRLTDDEDEADSATARLLKEISDSLPAIGAEMVVDKISEMTAVGTVGDGGSEEREDIDDKDTEGETTMDEDAADETKTSSDVEEEAVVEDDAEEGDSTSEEDTSVAVPPAAAAAGGSRSAGSDDSYYYRYLPYMRRPRLRTRARQVFDMSGMYWKCERCRYWAYKKDAIRRHQINMKH